MQYTVGDYAIIIAECKTLNDVNKIKESFMEDKLLYSNFEYYMVNDMLFKRNQIIKSLL